ncbi:LCP family protein [Galactobacter valiniphilus]|uniref:LCP family protein n=1 Tax=Galactobacter valiniphilus TaxID=2676122 RepID=UPI0037363213
MSLDTQPNGYVPRRLHRKPRRIGRTVLLAALMVVVCVLGVGGTYAAKFATALGQSETLQDNEVFPTNTDRPYKDPGDASMNILLLGADKSATDEELDISATSTDQRSDSMMLVHIPADRKRIYIMSVVRDSWVDIPGVGKSKINAAMSYGGVPKLVETLEGLFDQKIDHVAMVDFSAFRELTKAIGGVTVNNPKAFCAYKTTPDVCFEAGNIHIEGQRALKWVRERHAFPGSDYQRVRNQQQFLKAVFKKVLSPEVLASPNKLFDVVNSVMPYVTTDKGLKDAGMLVGLGMQMTSLRSSDLVSFTVPTSGSQTIGGQSVEIPDYAAITKIGQAMAAGTLDEYYASIKDKEAENEKLQSGASAGTASSGTATTP